MLLDFAESVSGFEKFGSKSVFWGAALPGTIVTPVDKDLWFEPSYAPQPWEYDAGNNVWRSQPVTFDICTPSNLTGTARIGKPFPIGTTSIWLESYTSMISLRSLSGGTSSTDYITASVYWSNTSGTNTLLDTAANTNGSTVATYKRTANNLYQYVTNPFQIIFEAVKTGSNTINYQIALSLTYKFVRANS